MLVCAPEGLFNVSGSWLHDYNGAYDPNIMQQLNALFSFGIGKMKCCTVKDVSFIVTSQSR
jgi:hypothetical protein